MPRFLTQEWVDAFNETMSGVAVAGPGPDAGLLAQSGRFVVAEEVRDAPDGDVTLLLFVDDGQVRLALAPRSEGTHPFDPDGQDASPDVTIALSYEDAVSMAKGELTPADALNGGRVRVRGDLAVLVAGQHVLAAARHSTGTLAADTSY